jgi:hypothetical protein
MNDHEPDETGNPLDINELFDRVDELAAGGMTVSEALAQAWEEVSK